MTHTPGPWQANQSELEAHSALVEIRTAPNGDYKICDCGYQNARLIAAAPDLLFQLKLARDYYAHLAVCDDANEGEHDRIIQAMEHTIAKAEGRA